MIKRERSRGYMRGIMGTMYKLLIFFFLERGGCIIMA